jgi:two-component sensor histidine kinase/FixJ family two-component response regulator
MGASDRTVLIVEDNEELAQFIKALLETVGFPQSAIVLSGDESLEQTERIRPAIVLMDIVMPASQTDGVAAAGLIRDLFNIPVVFLTGHADPQTVARAKQVGAFGYVLKPLQATKPEALAASLETALYNFQLQEERSTELFLSLNVHDLIQSSNTLCEQTLRYGSGRLIGRCFASILRSPSKAEFWRMFSSSPQTSKAFPLDLELITSANEICALEASILPAYYKGALWGVAIRAQNVTPRRRAEQEINKALKEKEVLLREVHHRMRNHLSTVSALVRNSIRQLSAASTRGRDYQEILDHALLHIDAFSILHEELYRSPDQSKVNLRNLIDRLTHSLAEALSTSALGIRFVHDLDDAHVNVDTATPCGLVLNELLTNAVKHAFVGRKGGTIKVSLHEIRPRTFALQVLDDGIGLPPGVHVCTATTSGLQLVNGLVKQLHGQIEREIGQGTAYKITFTELTYQK